MSNRLVAVIALISLVGSPALACSCRALTTPEAKSRYAELLRDESVKLRVLSFRIDRKLNDSPIGEAVAQVIEQPKKGGPYPETIVVTSRGGDQGANCGLASWLFSAVSDERDVHLHLSRESDDHFSLWGCDNIGLVP